MFELRHQLGFGYVLLIVALVAGGCSQGSPVGPDPLDTPGPITEPAPVPTPAPAPAPAAVEPDLVISSLTLTPGSPSVGDEITFRVIVRNTGNAGAAASMLRFKVGGESNPPVTSVPALGAGEEYSHERKVTLNVAQNYVATATADALAHVSESDEANNQSTLNFSVGSAPGQADLLISNINFSPGSPRAGDEITFWVFVRNAGTAQAGPSALRFKVGGESNPPVTSVPALAPGQEYRHERKVTLNVAQNYLVTATADALAQVSESDETNNVRTRTFTVAPAPGQPDLLISTITFSPGSPTAGGEITFRVFVKNVGTAQAAPSTLRFKVGGETFPPETAVPALGPGQQYRHERKVTLNVAQNYLVTATADALGQVSESDETNNVKTRSFTVAPGDADLTISIINFSPGSPRAGDEITFWVFVKNEGTTPAGPSTLRFKVGGETYPPETPVPALGPGQQYRHERKVRLNVAQSYLTTATADALAQVSESNEANNIRTRSFTVSP